MHFPQHTRMWSGVRVRVCVCVWKQLTKEYKELEHKIINHNESNTPHATGMVFSRENTILRL